MREAATNRKGDRAVGPWWGLGEHGWEFGIRGWERLWGLGAGSGPR